MGWTKLGQQRWGQGSDVRWQEPGWPSGLPGRPPGRPWRAPTLRALVCRAPRGCRKACAEDLRTGLLRPPVP